jgi:hypothetical protein
MKIFLDLIHAFIEISIDFRKQYLFLQDFLNLLKIVYNEQ